jgi:hypothetical protein
MEAGMTSFLTKPPDFAMLKKTIIETVIVDPVKQSTPNHAVDYI